MDAFDHLICEFDKVVRTLFARAPTRRPLPGKDIPEAELTPEEKRHAAGLMRVNHCGEICAQALYQGQAWASSGSSTRESLRQAAWEETEHLNWTESRIDALGGRKSLLNPLWYGGALAIGVIAGRFGDPWSLGFLAETEHQVERHLDRHLARLPANDLKSLVVLQQMKADEISHADTAMRLGGRELPKGVAMAMQLSSRVMTGLAYYV